MFSCELFKLLCDQCFIQHYSDLFFMNAPAHYLQTLDTVYYCALCVKVMYITVLYTLLLNVHLCITAW